MKLKWAWFGATSLAVVLQVAPAAAQTFGVELQNNMMPASGGMAGTSITRPQDLQSAINANPATLRQFRGTQFSMGGGWADASFHIDQSVALPALGVTPFSATSGQPGAAVPNIGVTQDLSPLGLPATIGTALITNAGAGVDFRGVPESNGTSAQILSLELVSGVGVDITEKLSVGGSFQFGTSYLDGPFTGIGGMSTAYGARGTLGANYFITPQTSIGMYWQSRQHFDFDDAVVFGPGLSADASMDLPSNIGLGISNSSLMEGRLLLAMDVLYKQWGEADLFGQVYDNQWVYQFGAQYALTPRTRLRMGYAYNENPMQDAGAVTVGNVVLPDGVPGMRYIQGQFAAITQHRLTAGVGVRDIMLPGLDFDLFAGYAFSASDSFAATNVDVSGNYWLGAGATWRFGAGTSCTTEGCTN